MICNLCHCSSSASHDFPGILSYLYPTLTSLTAPVYISEPCSNCLCIYGVHIILWRSQCKIIHDFLGMLAPRILFLSSRTVTGRHTGRYRVVKILCFLVQKSIISSEGCGWALGVVLAGDRHPHMIECTSLVKVALYLNGMCMCIAVM